MAVKASVFGLSGLVPKLGYLSQVIALHLLIRPILQAYRHPVKAFLVFLTGFFLAFTNTPPCPTSSLSHAVCADFPTIFVARPAHGHVGQILTCDPHTDRRTASILIVDSQRASGMPSRFGLPHHGYARPAPTVLPHTFPASLPVQQRRPASAAPTRPPLFRPVQAAQPASRCTS